jgi:hypothetical protein
VTTEQESKLAVLAAVVVDAVVGATFDPTVVAVVADAMVVGETVDDFEEDELHAASEIRAGTAHTIPATAGRSLMTPSDRWEGRLPPAGTGS